MATYRLCKKCHRTWIVSKFEASPKSDYICPACADPKNYKEVPHASR